MTCCVDWATQLAEFYSALKSDKNEEENTVAVDEVELVEVVGSGGEATVRVKSPCFNSSARWLV